MDTVSQRRRSEIMGRVRAKDTGPEWRVRRLVFSLGYRYRLHVRGLPGKPDLVFGKRKKIIFVHGCFWHRHPGCALARLPKSRQEFWLQKLEGNRTRDIKNEQALMEQGWEVMTVWECELSDMLELRRKIKGFLDAQC